MYRWYDCGQLGYKDGKLDYKLYLQIISICHNNNKKLNLE